MDFLRRTFLEDPVYLYLLLAAAEAVLFVLWRRRPTRRAAMRLIVPPAIAAVVFVVEWAVVTPCEELVATVGRMRADAAAVRIEAVGDYLAEDFTFTGGGRTIDRETAIRQAEQAVSRFQVTRVVLLRYQLELEDHQASMVIGSQIITESEWAGGRAPYLTWTLRWCYGPDGWRIVHVAQPEVGLVLGI